MVKMVNKCFFSSDTGRGAELAKQLIRELAIPETATSFSVKFTAMDLVEVSCTYNPVERNSNAD